jgi:hypothetical protein
VLYWSNKARDARRITAAVKQQDTLGNTTKKNTEIAKELNITQVFDKIQE